jgi:hypothetical protein
MVAALFSCNRALVGEVCRAGGEEMSTRNPVVILCAVMLTLIATPALGQNVKTMKNGETEVRYHDGCVVHYDRHGHRTKAASQCTSNEIKRAGKAVAAYRQEQQLGNSSPNDAECPEGPPVGLGEHAWNRCGY